MKQLTNSISAFFALIRGGLWEQKAQLMPYGEVDYEEIMRLAEEQSIVGLVTAGLEHVVDVKVPQEWVLQFIGETLQIEQQNKEMNAFVAKLIEKLRKEDVYAILVKGQGIAQCYERPLWRVNGDVDLLLSNDNYRKAKKILMPLASSVEEENYKALHLGMTIDQWVVELHGTLKSCSMSKMDKVIDEAQKDIFYCGNVRSWMNGRTSVFLPAPDNDVFFVFTHILKHFFDGGIGLRQLCDLCRLLWIYRDTINIDLLEKRLKKARILTEWKAFAALSVEFLGMPIKAMPLYSLDKKWTKKAERIMAYIMDLGNFGHNREIGLQPSASLLSRKLNSLGLYTGDGIRQFCIFPLDSIRVWLGVMRKGISTIFNGKEDKGK